MRSVALNGSSPALSPKTEEVPQLTPAQEQYAQQEKAPAAKAEGRQQPMVLKSSMVRRKRESSRGAREGSIGCNISSVSSVSMKKKDGHKNSRSGSKRQPVGQAPARLGAQAPKLKKQLLDKMDKLIDTSNRAWARP